MAGYTTVVVAQSGSVTGQYDAGTNQITGTFTAADTSGDNSVYVVTYVPTDHDIKVHYAVDEPAGATKPSGTFTLPADTKISIKTDKGYQITSVSTPGYAIEKIDGQVIDWDNLATVQETAEDGTIITYYKLDDHTLISSDKLNVTFTNTAAVNADGELKTSHYDITLLPTQQQADVTYGFSNSNPSDDAVAKLASVANAKGDKTFTNNQMVYTDHDYNFTVPSIDGYAVTIVENVNSKTTVTEKPTKLAENQTVIDNGDNTYTIVTTTKDVKGAYTLDNTTLSAVMHAADASYVVTYTPKGQTVKVTYDVSKLSKAEQKLVDAPADGAITGATDIAYADKEVVSADDTVDYTKIAHKTGYTYALMANNEVVKDAKGNPITGMTTDFDLNDLPGTMTLTDGTLTVPEFTVVYTADKQDQIVTIDYADVPVLNKDSVVLTNHANSSDELAQIDLSKYVVDGYDMYVDGELVADQVKPSIAAETADTNDLTDGKDATPQPHKVTFKAKAVQKATLKYANYPKSAGTKADVVIDDGVSDTDIKFNVTADDLAVPGYSYVITRLLDDGKVKLDSEGHVIDEQTSDAENPIKATFTRDTSDNQTYVVTYTALKQPVTVQVVDDDNSGAQIDLAAVKDADKAWDSDTDAPLTYTTDQATALLKQLNKGTDLTVAKIDGADVDTKVGANVITIHVKHATKAISQMVTMDTSAVYGKNGLATDGQSVGTVKSQTATLTGTEDLYTGEVIAWDNPSVTLTVDVPAKAGYTPSLTTPDGSTLTGKTVTLTKEFPANVDFATLDTTFNPVVTYTADKKSSMVSFVDETQPEMTFADMTKNQMALPDGVTDAEINFKSVTDMIADLEAKGYVVDTTKTTLPTDATFNADNNDNQFTVYLKHDIKAATDAPETVTGTITYTGATQNPAPVTQTGTVTRHYSVDAVTGEEITSGTNYADPTKFKASTYQDATGDIDSVNATGTVVTFKTVATPAYDAATKTHEELKGYAVNTPEVTMTTSLGTDGKFESTYTPVPQDALVNFVDVTDGGKSITGLNIWGITNGGPIIWQGTKEVTGRNDDISDQLQTVQQVLDELTAQGYVVVTNPVGADGTASDK
ncbi:hypothetical protein ACAW68_08655 [Weissella confusa]|uniref:hypothetical protein n=1 Tax=Weissella confusa TaxID=1583 RepID=UPI0035A2F347